MDQIILETCTWLVQSPFFFKKYITKGFSSCKSRLTHNRWQTNYRLLWQGAHKHMMFIMWCTQNSCWFLRFLFSIMLKIHILWGQGCFRFGSELSDIQTLLKKKAGLHKIQALTLPAAQCTCWPWIIQFNKSCHQRFSMNYHVAWPG